MKRSKKHLALRDYYAKHQKTFLALLLCNLLINPGLAAYQEPWYKNGWKVAAAGWGLGAVCLGSLGTFIYMHYKKLDKEKKSSPVGLAFRFEDSKKHELSAIAAPCFLGSGAIFAIAATLLYRHGCQQK